jgi:hypothetical protein
MRTIALLDISRRMKFITAHWQFKVWWLHDTCLA